LLVVVRRGQRKKGVAKQGLGMKRGQGERSERTRSALLWRLMRSDGTDGFGAELEADGVDEDLGG
jgi:hypothetical protein